MELRRRNQHRCARLLRYGLRSRSLTLLEIAETQVWYATMPDGALVMAQIIHSSIGCVQLFLRNGILKLNPV